MNEPEWVDHDVAYSIHERQLAEHGGDSGVRDDGLLASALGRPRNLYACGEPPPDLCALAAAYAFGIAMNHPFIDGNKRTAAVVCELFLLLNGLCVTATEEAKYPEYIRLASGEHTEESFAEWLRTVTV